MSAYKDVNILKESTICWFPVASSISLREQNRISFKHVCLCQSLLKSVVLFCFYIYSVIIPVSTRMLVSKTVFNRCVFAIKVLF